ncbi:MAG TPA: DUF5908 family protein [Candidatus Angelobacter sp.]|jgi:hypothetical protein
MPIEIRELVIRAVVSESATQQQQLERALAGMKQEILEECREKMREMARRVNDR